MSEKIQIPVFAPGSGMDLAEGSIDVSGKLIRGVSIATAGVEAIGHWSEIVDANDEVVGVRRLYTDEDTLFTLLACADKIGEPVKAKVEHDSGLSEIIGTFDNFRIEGNHLRADLKIFETAASGSHVMTLAQNIPKQFGVSVTASMVRQSQGDRDIMRFTELTSCDFVDEPAINASLFERGKNKLELYPKTNYIENTMTPEEVKAMVQETVKTALTESVEAAMKPITDKLTAYEDRVAKMESLVIEVEPKDGELEKKAVMSEDIVELKDEVAKMSKILSERIALGIPAGASASQPVKIDEPEDFDGAIKAKMSQGKSRIIAFDELSKENPELVRLTAKQRNIPAWKLATQN